MRSAFKFLVLGSASVLALTLSAPGAAKAGEGALPAASQAPEIRSFNIPAGDLGRALNAFARQADQEILFTSDLVAGRRTAGVTGRHSSEEALAILLRGTGVGVSSRNGAVVTLRLGNDSGPDSGSGDEISALPEVLVEGSRSFNADIRRTENDIQPYVVFDRSAIEASNANNVEDLLKTRLPMNSVSAVNAQSQHNEDGPISRFDLRGLGQAQTLVLVNGRRVSGTSMASTTGEFGQPDVNGIPLSAIERIEVLPATASGIYGGGAVGGVINIVLRSDYEGLDVRATYENAFDTDVAQRRLDITGGLSLEGGRTSVTVSASRSDSNRLLYGDRDFQRRAIALQAANAPDGLQFLTAYTPTITSLFGDPLTLDNGAALNSTFTFVPAGYAGPATDGGQALLANAGRLNLEPADDLSGNRRSLLNNPTVTSVNLTVSREMNDRLRVFFDGSYSKTEGRNSYSPFGNLTAAFSPDSPFNPFQQLVLVTIPFPGVEAEATTKATNTRLNAGLIYKITDDWSVQFEHSWSRASNAGSMFDNPVGLPILLPIVTESFDVFRDLNAYPADWMAGRVEPRTWSGRDTTLEETSVRIGGPALSLPAGEVFLTASLARRQETVEDSLTNTVDLFGNTEFLYYPEATQEVTSGYAETRVPLVSARNPKPFAQELEVQLSARYDRYETTGTSRTSIPVPDPMNLPAISFNTNAHEATSYTAGLKYRPVRDLVFRASLGTGFLPANPRQITSSDVNLNNVFRIRDPLRGNTPNTPYTLTRWVVGGSQELKPERSESFSAGFILTPRFLGDFRLSVDYVRIEKKDEIAQLDAQFIIDNEALFPDLVTRGPNLPGDPAGWAGPITGFDGRLINLAGSETDAVDIQVDKYFTLGGHGELRIYAVATHALNYVEEPRPGASIPNQVGYAGGPLNWRGNGGVEWRSGPVNVNWNVQFYDDHFLYASNASSSTADFYNLSQGAHRLPSQIYHDVQLRYEFDAASPGILSRLEGAELTVGIKNLFDADPPIVAWGLNPAGYSAYGDSRLRRYSVSLRKSF